MLRVARVTRSSADADNRRDKFSGQSRSTNMVPFGGPFRLSRSAVMPFAQYMEYGKFDLSVNRKRLKLLGSRLGYIITLQSRVVM